MFEGRSINKLQSSLILLVFQILQIRSLGSSILSSSCEFYDDSVTVTSFVNITSYIQRRYRWNCSVTNSVPLLYFCHQS